MYLYINAMYHKVRSIKELADSAMKALASRSSRGEGCAAGQGQDGKTNNKERKLLQTTEFGLETAQGKRSVLEVPRDDRGDDSLYLVYTAEELRWILREMEVIDQTHTEPPRTRIPTSYYATKSGVVLSTSLNPDRRTGSRVHVYGGFWDNKDDSSLQVPGCITQCFRRKRSHEAVWACFESLPIGRHTYALGLGYDLDVGDLSLSIRAAKLRPIPGDFDGILREEDRLDRLIEGGKFVEPHRMIPVDFDFLFSGSPIIAVFEYDHRPMHIGLWVSLEVDVPNMFFQHATGLFHHIQLVQID